MSVNLEKMGKNTNSSLKFFFGFINNIIMNDAYLKLAEVLRTLF